MANLDKITRVNIIKKFRKNIEKIDKNLIFLLGERFNWTKKIGVYKTKNNLPAKDTARELEMFQKRILWAKESGVDENIIEKIFNLIIKSVKRKHKIINIESKKKNNI